MSSEAQASLEAALQNMNVAWQEVRAHWRDAKAVEFQERYLRDLPARARQAAQVMAEIEQALKKVKADCG